MKHSLVPCLALLLGSACGGKSSGTGAEAGVGVTLPEGNLCGTGSVTLTKQVPLSLGTVPPDLEVGPAWIAHSSEDYTSYLYGAIKVTNNGTVGRCYVKAGSISFRDQAGEPLKSDSLAFVYGRVKVMSVVSTWTCLDPGDSGYFNLIEKLSYLDVASIHVGEIRYQEVGNLPLADLRATDTSATGGSVSVVVDNVGTGSARNAALVLYALSASGEFRFWTFADFASKELWGPGEKRTATGRLSYQAPCAKLLTVPYYDATEASSPSNDEEILANAQGMEAVDALMASRLRQAQQAEMAKLAPPGQ